MDRSKETITTMGVIAEEVYNTTPGKDYFSDNPNDLIANGKVYEVIDTSDPDDPGFNALLLREAGTNNYVIAFRGTQEKLDILEDVIIGLQNFSPQYYQALAFVDRMKNEHGLTDGQLTLTGHSLGGILAQAVGVTKHIQGYAFNPYGVDRLLSMPVQPTFSLIQSVLNTAIYKIAKEFGMENPDAAWARDNILNVMYFDEGKLAGDPLSNLATQLTSEHLGDILPIFGPDIGADAHKMGELNDAIEKYNEILAGTTPPLDYLKLTQAFASNTFLRNDDYQRTYESLKSLISGQSNVEIELLNNYSRSSLASLVRENPAFAFALEKLNGFAVTGAAYNDPIDYHLYSDKYIEDRLDFILESASSDTYYFDDTIGESMSDYKALTVGFVHGSFSTGYQGKSYGRYVIYGSEADNTIVAASRADNYVEGGLGGDTIRTGMGDDTIFTNADIEEKYDMETASTVNRVYAGDGDDKVYGSNGTDIVYADSDSSDPDEYHESDYVEGRGSYDVIYGGGDDDILYGDSASSHADTSGDYLVGGFGADSLYGSDGDDTIYGDRENPDEGGVLKDDDTIYGYGGDDTIYAGADEDTVYGGIGDDTIYGNEGEDTLVGGVGNDRLDGGEDKDTLNGGEDYDTYVADDGDTVIDIDGSGRVFFNGRLLSGGEWDEDAQAYLGDGGKYYKTGGGLTFVSDSGDTLVIEAPLDNTTDSKENKEDDTECKTGDYEKITTVKDKTLGITLVRKDRDFVPGEEKECPPDDEDFSSPLVLDLNGDGKLSTPLFGSQTYFDMDGDGFMERTAWVQQGDGLLAMDRDGDGKIGSGKELFGNFTPLGSGAPARDAFEALAELDENHDGVINADDSAYADLKIWKDDGDGVTESGELVSMGEAGVESIVVNPWQTLLSLFDANRDGRLDASDPVFSKMVFKETESGAKLLYVPKTDNDYVNALLQQITGVETISTDGGEFTLAGVASSALENVATEGDDTLTGSALNEKIVAKGGDDLLEGAGGRDILLGQEGDDTLDGGSGDDLLIGGSGDDTYRFGRGYGVDVVEDASGLDKVVFASDIAAEDLVVASFGDDLVVALKEEGVAFNDLSDKLVFKDWYAKESRVETFVLGDGTPLSSTDILSFAAAYENSVQSGRLIAPDAIDESEVASFVLVQGPERGSVVLEENGEYRFDAGEGFGHLAEGESETVSFRYAVETADGRLSHEKEVTVTVYGQNSAPEAAPSFDIVDLSKLRNTNAAQVVQSKIVNYGDGYNSVDHWVFDFEGGNLKIDLLSELASNGHTYVDIDQNGVQTGIDTYIYLYEKDDNGQWRQIVSNDDSSSGRSDGSSHSYDSYVDVQLAPGEYMLAVGTYRLYGNEALEGRHRINSSTGTAEGPYQITFSKELVFKEVPENAVDLGYAVDHYTFDLSETANDPEGGALTFSEPRVVDADGNPVENAGRFVIDGSLLRYYPSEEYASLQEGESRELNVIYTVTDGSGAGTESMMTLHLIPSNYTHIEGGVNQEIAATLEGPWGEGDPVVLEPVATDVDAITVEKEIGGEGLQTMEDAGITEIDLQSGYTADLDSANPITYETLFVDGEGREAKAADVWFARDGQDTKYLYAGNVAASVEELPNLKGFGRVIDLTYAMNDDAQLAQKVARLGSDFSALSLEDLAAQTDELLARWTGTDGIDPSQTRGEHHVLNHDYGHESAIDSYRVNAYAKDVAMLEAFAGTLYRSVDASGNLTSDVLGVETTEAFNERLRRLRYGTLADLGAQVLFGKEIYDAETGDLDRETLFTKLSEALASGDDATRRGAVNLLSAMLYDEGIGVFGHLDSSVLGDDTIRNLLADNGIELSVDDAGEISGTVGRFVYGTSEGDSYDYGSGTNGHARHTEHGKHIFAGAGDDTIVGTNSHDVIYGGDGDDTINGYSGDDIIYGGAGDDTLIADNGGSNYGYTVLVGGEGDDTLKGSRRQGKYIYTYGDGHDTIIDPGNVGTKADKLEFKGILSSDVRMDRDGRDMILLIDDVVTGEGTSGSVRIVDGFGGGKMEVVQFEDGKYSYDELLALYGADDTAYTYRRGEGRVEIDDILGFDTLTFGDGIAPGDIVTRVLEDGTLQVGLAEEGKSFDELGDVVTLKRQLESGYGIDAFRFADGTVMNTQNLLLLQSGTEGDDYVVTEEGDIVLDLKGGDDTFLSASGTHTVRGGAGDDTLHGGTGDDTYLFGRGSERDTVYDAGGADAVRFDEGIAFEDLLLRKEGNDIVVALKEEGKAFDELGDRLVLKEWYRKQNRVETFLFADGTAASLAQIQEAIPNKEGVYIGTDADETITGDPDYADILYGEGGDDIVTGAGRDDLIYGGAGDDTLRGAGGDDALYGDAGDDTYLFARGDGADTLHESGGLDTVRFAEGIDPESLRIVREGDDIVIDLGAGDTLRLAGWYTAAGRIERFEFADGTVLGYDDMTRFMGGDGDDRIEGFDGANAFDGRGGDDTLLGKGGDDRYLVSPGHDTVVDTGGVDTLVLPEGVAPEDLRPTWMQGTNDVLLAFEGREETVLLKGWYTPAGRIERFEFADGSVWGTDEFLLAFGQAGDDVFKGIYDAANTLDGGAGDDIISAFGGGDDTLRGGTGDDTLESYEGDDTLDGGAGSDLLKGGAGDDTYVVGADGAFTDTVVDASGQDTLRFAEGIVPGDLEFAVSADSRDLTLRVGEQTVVLSGWFAPYSRIETFAFADGTTLGVGQIAALMETAGDDTLRALDEGSAVRGGAGDDTLYGAGGGDALYGGTGDDALYGGAGRDTLDGGTGGDLLDGQGGDDLYLFARGDGSDTLFDNATRSYETHGYIENPDGTRYWGRKIETVAVDGGVDTLRFAEGIGTDDIVVRFEGEDLTVALLEPGKSFDELSDKVRIEKFFDARHTVERFEFADGTVLDADGILDYLFTEESDDVAFAGDAPRRVHAKGGDDEVRFGGGDDTAHGDAGDDTLYGGAGRDTLYGDAGADTLYGDGGNDLLDGGAGDDLLAGGSGDDRYRFDLGGGEDTIVETLGRDRLLLDAAAGLEDLAFAMEGEDLLIRMEKAGESAAVRLQGWSGGNSVELLELSDGTQVDIRRLLTPAVEDLSVTLPEDGSVTSAIAADSYGTLSFETLEGPTHGSFTVDGEGVWRYTPEADFYGDDRVRVRVSNEYGGSSVVTIGLQVTPVADAPEAADDALTLPQNGAVTIAAADLLANDTDPDGADGLRIADVTYEGPGTLSLDEAGDLLFDPGHAFDRLAEGESETVEAVCTVVDADGLADTSVLRITVTGVNDAPVVEAQMRYELDAVRTLSDSVAAVDPEGDALRYEVARGPAHGTLSIDGTGAWRYEAEAAFNGSDEAVVAVVDSHGARSETTLAFDVSGYLFAGEDMVIDDRSGGDTLRIADYGKESLSFSRSGDDLLVRVDDTATVTLKDYFADTHAAVDTILTADGPLSLARESVVAATPFSDGWNAAMGEFGKSNLLAGSEISDMLNGGDGDDVLYGGAGDDMLSGFFGDDTLLGGEGNDTLMGNEGADTLYGDGGNDLLIGDTGDDTLLGGDGFDMLHGMEGDDTLFGGKGFDLLEGGAGNDRYLFAKGDGVDTVTENGGDGEDTLAFAPDVAKEEISFAFDNGVFTLQYSESDSLTVLSDGIETPGVERLELSDGSYMDTETMELVIQQINAWAQDAGLDSVTARTVRDNEELQTLVTSAWKQNTL